jgi:hypothetical protein
MPLQIISYLQKEFPEIEFKELDGIDEIQKEGRELFIIDSVQGLKKCTVLKDMSMLETKKPISIHEFDLAQNLKLLRKIKAINNATIIGVPMKMGKEKSFDQVCKIIKNI